MTPVADNPVIVPDREVEEDRHPTPNRRASAAHYAAGRRAKRTNGSASAAMAGTPSIREVSAHRACTSGLRPSASRAANGRRILSGMRSEGQ
jgi:hypothetical protein